MRLLYVFFFVLVLGCSGSYATTPTPAEAAEQLVEIRFEGNKILSDAEVTEALGGPRVRRDVFERGVLLLHAAYYDRGYLAVKVSVSGTPEAALVRITEGDRFRVSSSELVEIDPGGARVEMLPSAATLAPDFTRFAGDWFNRGAVIKLLDRVRRAYRDEGYANVDVEPITDLDSDRHVIRLQVPIKRGPLVQVREVRVVGAGRLSESQVRGEIDLAPGDSFNETKLDRARERLLASGRFKHVDISTDATGSVITFHVDEAQ
jgi:outer membrane protein insertion porin family